VPYIDGRSYRRRRQESRLHLASQAVDMCLQQMLEASEEEKARIERELEETDLLLQEAGTEERALDRIRALNEQPWEAQLRSPRKMAHEAKGERERRAKLLASFSREMRSLKEASAVETARSELKLHALQERLALTTAVRSHAAGALEADKFVETAMLAARQRLQVRSSMNVYEVLSRKAAEQLLESM